MFLRINLVFLVVLVAVVACTSSPSPEPPIPDEPLIGHVVPTGQVEIRDLSPTTELVSNCGNGSGTIVKHPSMSVVTNYAVEWEVGGTVGVGLTIGEGVIPAGVNLESSLHGLYATQFDQGVQQSTNWDLPAEQGYIIEYTLMWRELWQPGYIDVTLADKSVTQINIRYRTGIQSDIIGQRSQTCEGGSAVLNSSESNTDSNNSAPSNSNLTTTGLTATDMNSLFGEGNWFCFPDRENGVGVKKLQPGLVVNAPLIKVDTEMGTYEVGESPLGLGATAWLNQRLPREQCPQYQQEALSIWASERASDIRPFNRDRMNELFGSGNWECISEFTYAVKITNFSNVIEVKYPITTLDDPFGRHSVGETVQPSGEATAWIAGAIPRDQCP